MHYTKKWIAYAAQEMDKGVVKIIEAIILLKAKSRGYDAPFIFAVVSCYTAYATVHC